MRSRNGRLSKQTWITLILFMFIGAVAGNVESMYIGLYLNNTVFKNGSMGSPLTLTDTINLIISLSAIVSGVTTFVVGAISEKLKNRKIFISIGYILWGVVMLGFAFVRGGKISGIFQITEISEIVTATAATVIVFSLIMALLRSATADTVFNSWVTDVSTPEASPKIETAFTIMGFVSTAVITAFVANAEAGIIEYSDISIAFGGFAIVSGVLGFYLITNPPKQRISKKERRRLEKLKDTEKKTSYWSDIFYGLKPSVIKENVNLYLILSSGCLFNCSFQVFYPYLFIYLASVVFPANENVDLSSAKYKLIFALAIVVLVLAVPRLMKAYSKNKKALSFIVSVLCFVVGLLILSTTTHIVGIVIGLSPALIGYIIIMIQFGATVRDNIPQDKVGLFQGVRMLFLVLIPMVVGPTLGNIAAKNSEITYMENGAEKVLPTEAMFLYAAIVAALIFIPMLPFLKKDKEKSLRLAQQEAENK